MTIPSGGPLMLIVLLLLVLAIAVYVVSRNVKANREAISQMKQEKETTQASASQAAAVSGIQSDEEAAAFIALHLYLSQAIHDRESGVITIERIERRYSPWNSKIYNMNNILR